MITEDYYKKFIGAVVKRFSGEMPEGQLCHDDLPHLWKVGDIVSRDGTDEQEIIEISHDWNMLTVKCIKEPEYNQWCKLGQIEPNLIRRYSFVRTGDL